jgi:16S rRNA processing protein RimM
LNAPRESRTLIAVGKVIKAFGLRGDVVIVPLTDSIARFKKLKEVFVGKTEDTVRTATVAAVTIEPRGVRLRLAGVADRTAAEKLAGAFLYVEEKDAIRLPKGTYFTHDIIGLQVRDEEGNLLGRVSDVLKYPANDVYVIARPGSEILIPAVKEFIRRIDLTTQTMVVKLIEGMLDDEIPPQDE